MTMVMSTFDGCALWQPLLCYVIYAIHSARRKLTKNSIRRRAYHTKMLDTRLNYYKYSFFLFQFIFTFPLNILSFYAIYLLSMYILNFH